MLRQEISKADNQHNIDTEAKQKNEITPIECQHAQAPALARGFERHPFVCQVALKKDNSFSQDKPKKNTGTSPLIPHAEALP